MAVALSLPGMARKGHTDKITYKLQFMSIMHNVAEAIIYATGQSQVRRADSGSRSAAGHDKPQKIGRIQESEDGSKQLSSSPNSNTSSIIAAGPQKSRGKDSQSDKGAEDPGQTAAKAAGCIPCIRPSCSTSFSA